MQIEVLRQVRHPHVVGFLELLRTTNNYYLVYQYAD